MPYTREELTKLLTYPSFPRSAAYDPIWTLENLMGPNVLWLVESLTETLALPTGARVLDLGCGKALSSIFLACEFQAQVWATDLWIAASENWQRIQEANLSQQIFPIHAEAHALPFAHGFFDFLLSFDAYHYFGTDDLYLQYVAQFVRPGGKLGIVVPGLLREFAADVPEALAPYWEPEFWTFHSPEWWRRHWAHSGVVEIEQADVMPQGWEYWLKWLEVCQSAGYPSSEKELEMVRSDGGRHLGFTRLIARRI